MGGGENRWEEKQMDEMMMELIAKIYGYMDDEEKASFTLEAAKEMVEDQIQIDKDAGREPLEYDPELFYDTICEFIQQDAEDED